MVGYLLRFILSLFVFIFLKILPITYDYFEKWRSQKYNMIIYLCNFYPDHGLGYDVSISEVRNVPKNILKKDNKSGIIQWQVHLPFWVSNKYISHFRLTLCISHFDRLQYLLEKLFVL